MACISKIRTLSKFYLIISLDLSSSIFPSVEVFTQLIIYLLISNVLVGHLLFEVPLVPLAKGRAMGISFVASIWLLSFVGSV